MFKFTNNFNCCKAVNCKNFGVLSSADYIQKSTKLGYLSTECRLCGSNPPWINNELISNVLNEKVKLQFSQKLNHCPKCSGYFFFDENTRSSKYGFTSAGKQRKQCNSCGLVFTMASFNKSEKLHAVLATILSKQTTREAIKATGLSTKSYYFYLQKLSAVLSNFSLLNEEKVIKRDYLGLHSEGRVLSLTHKRGAYLLITNEINSGYILLQSHNLTKTAVHPEDSYQSLNSTVVVDNILDDIEKRLIDRYKQNLQRKHFEQLLVGELKALTNSSLIYPDKLAYIHFQLLKAFTSKALKYDHFIEHESTLRAGALIASLKEIKKSNADVYFYLPLLKTNKKLNGKKIGWWNDRWYTNELSAYCPITSPLKNNLDIPLKKQSDVQQFYKHLDTHMNKGVNSFSALNQLLDIQRVLFNYCELKGEQSRASRFGVTDKSYTPASLLDEALKTLNN